MKTIQELKQDIQFYYIQEFSRQQSVYLRGKLLSLTLIVICNIQSISIQLTSNLLDHITQESLQENQDSQSVQLLAKFTHYFRIYPLINSIFDQLSENQVLIGFLIFSATLNSFIVAYQIIRFFLYKYRMMNNNFTKLSDIINSFILKIYIFVFYFSFSTASFEVIFSSQSSQNEIIFSVFNLILTLLISFCQNQHDFSFSFVLDDYMASIDTHSKYLELIFNQILVIGFIASKFINQNIIAALHITFVTTKILLQIIELIYYDNLIIKTHLLFKFIHVFNSVLFCLSYNFPHIYNGTQLTITILAILPFSYIIADSLLYSRINLLALKQNQYKNLQQINLHIRTAYFIVKHLEMHDYTDLRRSVLYESIYQNHYNTCSRKDCFCELLMRENGFSWEELQGFTYRDSFISQYFAQMYSDYLVQIKENKYLKKEDYNQACFNYLTFLIEVVNVPTRALAEVIQISNSEKRTSSIKDQMVYQQIYNHGEKTFFNFFNNPTIYNQKLQFNKVLEFDQLFLNTQQSLKQSLILLRKMLIDLSKKQVDIAQIDKMVQKIKYLKMQTLLSMKKMYRYNPYSKRCQQIAEIYSRCLDLQNKRPQEYLSEAEYQNRQYQNSYKNIDKEVNLFSRDACVINISLIQPIGVIKNASISTQLIFGYSPQELINKNCNILIPDQLNQIHSNILSKFVSSGEMNRIIQGQLQIFGINKNGFAVPLNLRIKLDQSESNYFGASALFTQQNHQISDFIIFSTSGNITNLTEKIYNEIFKNAIPKDHIRSCQKLDLFKILPILQINFNLFQSQNQKLSAEYKSIFISPQNEKAISVLSYKQSQPFNLFLDFVNLCKKFENKDFKFYEITFQVGKLQTSYKNFELGFIQIEDLKQIKKKIEIQALLKDVNNQIEKLRQLCQLELDLHKQNDSFKQLEIEQRNTLQTVQFSQRQNQNEIKSIMSIQNQLTRPSLSSQISHLSAIKILSHQSHTEFGSFVDHFEPKQIDPICDQLSNNQYLNKNRKLLNNLDKYQINNEIVTDQSYDQQFNLVSSPVSGRSKQNSIQENKLLLNDIILEDDKNQTNQDNQDGIIENILSNQCNECKNTYDFKQIYEIYEPQNQKIKNKKDQICQKNKIIQQNLSQNLNQKIEDFSRNKKNKIEQNQQQIFEMHNYEQNQSNSVNSSISEFHTFKLTLKRAVTCRRQSKSMIFLFWIGIFINIAFILLAYVLYNYQQIQLNYINTLNQNLVKGYEIMNEFVSIIAHTEYIKMYNKGIIQNSLTQQELKSVLAEPLVIQQHFKNTVIDLEEYDRNTWYGQYIRSQYQQIIFFNQRNISSMMDLRMIFSFVSMTENLYMYSQRQTEVYLRYIHYNQKNNIESFQNMANLQKQEIDSVINTMKSFQVISIIALEVFTLLMSIQIIPIYVYIQYKKEQILKLFCTFQSNQLVERIQILEYFINQDMLQDSNEQILITKCIDNMKKRTISSTNQLQKINIKIVAIVTLIFCFISLYPIANFVISNTFINEFTFTSNELSLIYSFRGKAPLILAFNFLRQTATYEQRPGSLLSDIDGQLENTYSYIRNTTNDVVQLLKNQSIQNLIQDKILHRQIVELTMSEDICSPLSNYQQKYLDPSHQIDLSDCSTIQNGIWNKGYLLGLQSLTNILSDFQQMYKASLTTDEFAQSLNYLYQENNGTQFIKVFQYLRVVPLMIGNYIISEMNAFCEQSNLHFLLIFILIIILGCMILLILWSKYYRYLVERFFDTRQIFGLFPSEFICQNPYVYNYVMNEYQI